MWKKHFISSSGFQVPKRNKNGLKSCVKSLSSSNVRNLSSIWPPEVRNGLCLSAAENFTHRDWLHVIKRGKRLYKNRFYETYHVNRVDAHRDCPTIAKQKQGLYRNKFPETSGVPIPENWKKNKKIVIVIAIAGVVAAVVVVVCVIIVVVWVINVVAVVGVVVCAMIVVVWVVMSIAITVNNLIIVIVIIRRKFTIIVIILIFLNFTFNTNAVIRDLSIVSIAKASLCLRNPSIIISERLSIYTSPFYLWHSRLSPSIKTELKLQSTDSFSITRLPVRGITDKRFLKLFIQLLNLLQLQLNIIN